MMIISMEKTPAIRAPFLDGLRGWGALIVVAYHTFVEIYPTSPHAADMLMRFAPFNGSLAVVIFFIVSGFSLSMGFLQSGDRSKLKQILIGRYFRLAIPILIATIVVYLSARVGLILNPERKIAAQPFFSAIRFALFGVFFDNYNPVTTPIPQLWTMPIELLGSILVLTFLWIVGLRHFRFPIYVLILCALCLTNPFIAAFVVGAVFAEINKSEQTAVLQSSAILMFFLGLIGAIFLPGKGHLAYLADATLISFGAIFSVTGRRILSNAASRFLGKISFSLYLLHGLVIYSYGTWLIEHSATPATRVLANMSTVILAVGIAWAFRWVDVAGIRTAHLVTPRIINSLGAVVLMHADRNTNSVR